VEIAEFSTECKELLSKEIMLVTDQVSKAQHIIATLMKKNNKREKEISEMAIKADKLMSKFSNLKDKAGKVKHIHFKNKKELNSAIGSRLLAYLLDTKYRRNMRQSLLLVQGFSRFDKDFFIHARKLVEIYKNCSKTNLQIIFHKWYKNVLDPAKTSKIPYLLENEIFEDEKKFNTMFSQGEKLQKIRRSDNLEECAKDRLYKVFYSVTIREQKRMFDIWKDLTKDFR
jgi:hypothetical protein